MFFSILFVAHSFSQESSIINDLKGKEFTTTCLIEKAEPTVLQCYSFCPFKIDGNIFELDNQELQIEDDIVTIDRKGEVIKGHYEWDHELTRLILNVDIGHDEGEIEWSFMVFDLPDAKTHNYILKDQEGCLVYLTELENKN